MCLAIYKPAATPPDYQAYKNGYYTNDHGAGFAACHEGGLVIAKGFFEFDKFWNAFKPYAECPALIHFRWATHGNRDEGNCHPFTITDDLAMIHNGIINIDTASAKQHSDTWHFTERVLKPLRAMLGPDFYRTNPVPYLAELAIGGSKVAFLRADGDCAIWNEDAGIWTKDGHWYSNDGFRRNSDPDWTVSDWSRDVPVQHEWVADELLCFGYTKAEIEMGFREDPEMMCEHLDECYADCEQ